MRSLTISLIFIVLIVVAGVGLVLNTIAGRQSSDLAGDYEQLVKQLSSAVDQSEDPRTFIDHWNVSGDLSLDLLDSRINSSKLSGCNRSGEEIYCFLDNQNKFLEIPYVPAPQGGNESLHRLLTTVYYLVLVGALLLWLSPLIRRLHLLRVAANKIGEGEFSATVEPGRFSYIRDIEIEFNRMAAKIHNLVDDNKLLSSAVSHELRNPLSVINLGVLKLAQSVKKAEQKETISVINRNLHLMDRLINSMLELAEFDHHFSNAEKRETDFCSLLNECVNDYPEIDKKIECTVLGNNYSVYGNKDYLEMMVNNLALNGLKYASSTLLFTLAENRKNIVLSVADDGPGIPETQRENVVLPFTSVSDNSELKSNGIGLAVVNRIARWHEATLEISTSPILGGALFTVTLPKYSQSLRLQK